MKRLILAAALLVMMPLPAFATQVQEVISPGGLKAWLVEEHALPLVAVKIAFRGSGSAYDPKGKEGRANMTAAMLMEGAGDLDSHAFNAAIENKAISLNFAIDEDYLQASMGTLSEHKEEAFSYLATALTKPRFDDKALERVRSQTLFVLAQQEKEPSYILRRAWEKQLFANHPYSNPSLGLHDTVSALSAKDLRDFTQRTLTRANAVIAVVGDITPKELAALLDTHLGGLPAHYAPDVTVPDIQVPDKAKQVVIESDIPQTMVMFGTRGIARNDPDYYAAYVMNQILGSGGLSSKLAVEIREKRGLAYSIYSRLDPMTHSALWQGAFATRNERVGSALAVLRDTLKDFAANGPTQAELDDAKNNLTGSFVLSLDSNGDIASFLISMQLFDLGRDYLDKRNAMMNAVRMEDVKRMAAKLTHPDGLQVVMVGKPVLEPAK